MEDVLNVEYVEDEVLEPEPSAPASLPKQTEEETAYLNKPLPIVQQFEDVHPPSPVAEDEDEKLVEPIDFVSLFYKIVKSSALRFRWHDFPLEHRERLAAFANSMHFAVDVEDAPKEYRERIAVLATMFYTTCDYIETEMENFEQSRVQLPLLPSLSQHKLTAIVQAIAGVWKRVKDTKAPTYWPDNYKSIADFMIEYPGEFEITGVSEISSDMWKDRRHIAMHLKDSGIAGEDERNLFCKHATIMFRDLVKNSDPFADVVYSSGVN